MVQSNNVYNLMVSFFLWSGIWAQLSWVLYFRVSYNQSIDCVIAILGPTGERSTFKAMPIFSEFSSQEMLGGGLQFLEGNWMKVTLSLLPRRPSQHGGLLCRNKHDAEEEGRERDGQQERGKSRLL